MIVSAEDTPVPKIRLIASPPNTGSVSMMAEPRWVEAGIGVRLKDAAAVLQMALRMLSLPIRGEAVDDTGWCVSGPGSLVRDIGPDAPLLDALAEATIPAGSIEDADRCVVGVKDRCGHDFGLDPFDDRVQHLHRNHPA